MSQCIVALIEGRGIASEVGVACYNTETAECTVGQLADTGAYSRTLTFLGIHSPGRILVCDQSDAVQSTSKLFLAIAEHFESGRMTACPRRMFSDNAGTQILTSLCLPELLPSLLTGLAKRYPLVSCFPHRCFALSALSALFSFMEQVMGMRLASRSIVFKVGPCEGILSMDYASARSLELVSNARSASSKQHLLGVLDHTLTSMGRRLLRLNILQPLSDMACIAVRQKCVQEMLENGEAFREVRESLREVPDVDHLITLIVQIPKIEGPREAERRIHTLLTLKQALDSFIPLATALHAFQHPLLALIRSALDGDNLRHLHRLLSDTINKDISYHKGKSMTQQQRAFAVNLGLNTLLDVARRTFGETVEDINEYASALAGHFDLPLQVKYKAPRGFHLSITRASLASRQLPGIFCNVTGSARLAFTTLDLLKLNQRIGGSLAEVFLLSDQ